MNAVQRRSGSSLWQLVCATMLVFCAGIPPVGSQSLPYKPLLKIGAVWVRIETDDTEKKVTLRWHTEGKRYAQVLTLPSGWTLWMGEENLSYLPSIMSWPVKGQDIMIVIGTTLTAAYGIRAPIIYRLHYHTWELVRNPGLVSFTNRGGFYVKGRRLYLWDYEMHPRQAHSDAQRYWLEVFSMRRGHLSQIGDRLTRRRYLKGRDLEESAPRSLPPNDDPLREFGLKWRWWGE